MPDAPLALTTDASDFAVGAILEQEITGRWRPLAFYSSRFQPTLTERNRPLQLADAQRSATERELLAGYRSVLHFQHLLEVQHFMWFTDHRPLVGMMAKPTDPNSAMQAQHLAFISAYTTDIQHVGGKKNTVADALSRVEIDTVSLGVDFRELARAQQWDPELPAVRTAATALQWQDVNIGGARLLCDVSRLSPRPWVPAPFRSPRLQPAAWAGPPQNPGIGKTLVEPLCVAQTQPRCDGLGTRVHRLPAGKGPPAHQLQGRLDSNAGHLI